ncbi:MAG: hypothetical protein GXO42_00180 [bacterium]|nr:hypothetical protein [bacterium]
MYNPALIARFPAVYDSKEFLQKVLGYYTVEEIIQDLLEDKINSRLRGVCTHGLGSLGLVEHDVLELAEQRIILAVTRRKTERKKLWKKLVLPLLKAQPEYSYAEYFFSFIAAKYIIAHLPQLFLQRFAETEAEIARRLLLLEYSSSPENFESVLEHVGLPVLPAEQAVPGHFLPEQLKYALPVPEYIRYTYNLKSNPSWQLTQRLVLLGYVLLEHEDVARIFKERYRQRIVETTPVLREPVFEEVREIVQRLLSRFRVRQVAGSSLPEQLEFREEALPPCMRLLYEKLLMGANLSHRERFHLAAFLLHVGLSVDDIFRLFARLPDFNERICRYQLEHIAGLRGGCKKYKPGSCKTLENDGICTESIKDELCKRVQHPLVYYIKKLKMLQQQASK